MSIRNVKLNSRRYHFLAILWSALLLGCNSSLNKEQLETYLQNEEHGTRQSYVNGDFKAELIYRPTDLIVEQELKSGQDKIELKKKYEQYLYFVLNMTSKNSDLLNNTAGNRSLFAGINQQLSFNMNEHAYIVDKNNDTTYLTDFAFPRLYEAARSTSVLFVFKKEQIHTEDFKICLKDIAYVKGTILFTFNQKDLKNVPSLKFE